MRWNSGADPGEGPGGPDPLVMERNLCVSVMQSAQFKWLDPRPKIPESAFKGGERGSLRRELKGGRGGGLP